MKACALRVRGKPVVIRSRYKAGRQVTERNRNVGSKIEKYNVEGKVDVLKNTLRSILIEENNRRTLLVRTGSWWFPLLTFQDRLEL